MYRKDIAMCVIFAIWGLFIFFGLERVAKTAHEMIVCFNVSALIPILSCLMLTIGPFSKWGDKKLSNRKNKKR